MKLVVTEMIMIIIFKRSFPAFSMITLTLTSQQSLVNPVILRYLTYDFSFVCANQKTHSHANKTEVDCVFYSEVLFWC